MSNLLEKASILLTPTAYDEERMLTAKPVNNFGNQIVPGFNFEDSSLWTIGTGASISNGQANFVGSQAQVFRNDQPFLDYNTKYQITYEVVLSNTSQGLHTNRGGTCLPLDLPSSVGVHTVYATSNSSGGRSFSIGTRAGLPLADITISYYSIKKVIGGDFSFTRSSIATRVNSSSLIGSIASSLPRINFLNGCGHLLAEPQKTNTATYSNDFSQGTNFNSGNRTLSDCVLSTSQGIAPDGTNTAQKLTDNNNGGTGAISLNSFGAGLTSDTDSTVSMFVKKDTVRYFVIKFVNFDTNQETSFDLDTGIVNRGTGVMTNYGNGWYRCSATFSTTTDLVGAIQFLITNDSSSTGGNLRDGSNSTFLWGYQAEENSFASSYIPTVAFPVTRSFEKFLDSGNSDLINHVEGVVYFNARFLEKTSRNFAKPISISDGTGVNSNTVYLMRIRNSQDTFQVNVKNPDSSGGGTAVTIPNCDEFFKIAIRYKTGETKVFLNGVQQGPTRTFSFSLNPFTKLNLSNATGSEQFEGELKAAAIFKEALSNDELECLTGSGFDSFDILARENGYTII